MTSDDRDHARRRFVMRLLRSSWASPVTLVGLFVAILVRAFGGEVARVDGVIEAGGGALGRWMRRFTRIDAITLGHVVIGTSSHALEHWRTHEHAHVRQYERWGALMPLLYFASSLREWMRGRDPYRRNVFEREARVVARRPHAAGRNAGARGGAGAHAPARGGAGAEGADAPSAHATRGS